MALLIIIVLIYHQPIEQRLSQTHDAKKKCFMCIIRAIASTSHQYAIVPSSERGGVPCGHIIIESPPRNEANKQARARAPHTILYMFSKPYYGKSEKRLENVILLIKHIYTVSVCVCVRWSTSYIE